MITIFAEHITERLAYVLDFCFKEKGQEYQLITSLEDWSKLETPGINYSNQPVLAAVHIAPQGILFERDVYPSKVLQLNNGVLEIDGVHDQFAVIFYLLTRYESYFSHKRDMHDRLSAKDNVLVKFEMHHTAVVDRIVMNLWEALELDYTKVKAGYTCTPTFDIDVAWAYKNRKIIRSVGALFKGKKPFERLQVLTGTKRDPYDTYGEIRNIATKTKQVICFILLGDWGKYDKNIHWKNGAYGSLIRGLNLEGEVGIHPSYASHLNLSKVREEINRLEQICGHEIELSRQHFLRLRIPETYQLLEKTGVNSDYSMGFADDIGFRAGTAFPFYFFDLTTNRKTTLIIHPFFYMDSALKDYLKRSPEEAIEDIHQLISEVKDVGGNFTFIWHNSSIHDKGEWKGWKKCWIIP